MSRVSGLEHVTVYRHAEGKWNGAFPEIVRLSNGDLVVAFREAPCPPTLSAGRSGHSHGDPLARGAIIRSTDGGQTWDPSTYRLLAEPLGGVEQISVSVISGDVLLSPYARLRREQTPVSDVTDPESWVPMRGTDTWVRRSEDGGDTWGEAVQMNTAPLALAPVHAPMLELPDGTILSPHCGSPTATGSGQHMQAVVRSHDGGRTWGNGSIIALDFSGKIKYHQCSLVRMPDGEIIAAMHSSEMVKTADGRDAHKAGVWLSRSWDDGYTWSPVEVIPPQIHGAAHHLLGLQDGRLICVWGNRHDPSIRVAVSEDRGKTWDTGRGWPLQEGEHLTGAGQRLTMHAFDGSLTHDLYTDTGEPCSTQLPDGRIVSVYYWTKGPDDPIRYIEAAIYSI